MMYYNTSNNWFDYHNGTAWFNPVRSATATGLGTDGRVFSATAAGLAEASGTLHWKNSTLSVGTTTAQNARGIYASGQVRATQGVRLGTSGSAPWIFPYSTVPGSSDSTGLNLSFYSYSTAVPHAFGIVGEIVTATSGTGGVLYVGKTFQPPSGTASWAAVDIMTGRSIIQTGGATGITRGVYVNPGLINVFDYRGVETTNNVGKAFYQSGSSAINNFAGNVNIGSILAPNRTLQVTGEVRITDLTTDAPTRFVGADGDGDLGAITEGYGINITAGGAAEVDTTQVATPADLAVVAASVAAIPTPVYGKFTGTTDGFGFITIALSGTPATGTCTCTNNANTSASWRYTFSARHSSGTSVDVRVYDADAGTMLVSGAVDFSIICY
jgi:hypothetical protein